MTIRVNRVNTLHFTLFTLHNRSAEELRIYFFGLKIRSINFITGRDFLEGMHSM